MVELQALPPIVQSGYQIQSAIQIIDFKPCKFARPAERDSVRIASEKL